MCGIAGIIHRDGPGDIGSEMTRMLQSMKHRGPDSSGFALYGPPDDLFVMRIKLADPNEDHGLRLGDRLERHRNEIEARLAKIGATDRRHPRRPGVRLPDQVPLYAVTSSRSPTTSRTSPAARCCPSATPWRSSRTSAMPRASRSATASPGSPAPTRSVTSGWRPSRTWTSPGAHPYWAYPFSDIAVVHNGQLTNYHMWRRRLERKGHRFQSECDSEIIAVYLAQKMDDGLSLETAMKESLDELDGVFTYLVVTADALGVAKDEMAAKPLVLYESPELVALASEEVAIRAVIGREIDTYDPYEREVLVWHR